MTGTIWARPIMKAPHRKRGLPMLRHSMVLIALICAASAAQAADRATCKTLVSLLEATDRGIEAVTAGTADKQPASGIATFAKGALDMAASFSTRDPLPDTVTAALTAIRETASAQMLVAAAPALLEQGRIVQQAMPQICPDSVVPDLARHGS